MTSAASAAASAADGVEYSGVAPNDEAAGGTGGGGEQLPGARGVKRRAGDPLVMKPLVS